MKKLFAIMMALVMCCSLVVSASAAEVETAYYSLDIDLDGEWSGNDEEAVFLTDSSEVHITIYTEYSSAELIDKYNSLLTQYEVYAGQNPDTCTFASGDFAGCPGFGFAEVTDAQVESCFIIISDDYAYEIVILSEDLAEFQVIATSMDSITLNSSFTGDLDADAGYEEDYEDEEVEEEEIVEEDEEEIVEEEEEEKKPSKDDKEDKDEDKDDKKDKEDKDDEKKDNTTLIIIIVAAVAVVAIAAVVIVLSKKKK